VTAGRVVVGDWAIPALVPQLPARAGFETVMHLLHTIVPIGGGAAQVLRQQHLSQRTLLQAASRARQALRFSSSGRCTACRRRATPAKSRRRRPSSHGSPVMSEWMLRDVAAVSALRYVSVCGISRGRVGPAGRIARRRRGRHPADQGACEAMVGKRPQVSIFGPATIRPRRTACGTSATSQDWRRALECTDYLRGNGKSVTLNVGYGHGYSVREVLRMVRPSAASPWSIPRRPRRAGDPAYWYARRSLPHRDRLAAALR